MRSRCGTLMAATLTAVIVAAMTFSAFAKGKTYTGTVGDALCGVEHSMPVSAVECIRQCIGKGSKYSLNIGDKVYTLDTDNQAFLDVLEKQAGARVEVRGTETENGKAIVVSSVKALP